MKATRFSSFTQALAPALVLGGLMFGFAAPAAAQDKKVEATVKALQKKAMTEDFLVTDFAKAKEKLEKAIAQCGTDKCSPNLRALLNRDLGVVLISGNVDKAKGQEAFVEAQKIDGTITLDKDFASDEVKAAWEAAKKGAATPSAKPGKEKPGKDPGGKEPASGGNPEGDFAHTPVTEALVRTPTPIYVEYSGSEPVVKVVARYKAFGMGEWKPLELKKMGDNGWGAYVPCLDVQAGKLSYFVQGFNEAKDPIASAGDRKDPYTVTVKGQLSGEPLALPGQATPKQCADTGDCPPDFPGCKVQGKAETPSDLKKAAGADCDQDTECSSKQCRNNVCADGEAESKNSFYRFWGGVTLGFDLNSIPKAAQVCKLGAVEQDTATFARSNSGSNSWCTTEDNSADVPAADGSGLPNLGDNNSINDSKNSVTAGGIRPGQFRVGLMFDVAAARNIMIGGRVGVGVGNSYGGNYAGNRASRFPATPLFVEARGTYVSGSNPFGTAGAHFYGALFVGVGNFESSIATAVVRNDGNGGTSEQAVKAWYMAGPLYFGAAGGARIAFTPQAALFAGVRLGGAVGFGGSFNVGPDIAFQYGFGK
jgi:hypothetical protein